MISLDTKNPSDFVRKHTQLGTPPLVPEIKLYLANEAIALWQATEEDLSMSGLPPPFWAFAWAGGQALSRYLLDQPEAVHAKHVLDFGSGSGLQAIAAARCGARHVTASEIDDFAIAAITLNAQVNAVSLDVRKVDLIDTDHDWDVVLAGDVCYEKPMAERVMAWLRVLATRGALVLLGDPGRTYLPKTGLKRLTAYGVKTSRELEDTDLRNAVVWQVSPE